MAFPTSPSDGDIYTNSNGTTYEYDDTDDKWVIVSQSSIDVASLNADLMNGEENSVMIPCMLDGDSDYSFIGVYSSVPANKGADNLWLSYTLPLPTNRGGDKLHIGDLLIHVRNADGDDYINWVYVDGHTYVTLNNLYSDSTNRQLPSANETQFTYVTGEGDVSAYWKISVRINCIVATASELQIEGVYLECWYDGDVSNDVAVSKADFEVANMIGAENAEYVNCGFASADPIASIAYDNVGWRNTGAVDFICSYDVPLPSKLGDLKLYAVAWTIEVMKADISDYIDRIKLYGRDTVGETWYNPATDATNLTSLDDHEYVFPAPVDLSATEKWMLWVECFSTTALELYVNGIALKVFYAP